MFSGGNRGGLGGYSPQLEASSHSLEEILGSCLRKFGRMMYKNCILPDWKVCLAWPISLPHTLVPAGKCL